MTAGATCINILAPRPYQRKVEDKDSGTEEIVRVVSFKTVSVFDISQTEGAELPSSP